jgi:hypothetical protein
MTVRHEHWWLSSKTVRNCFIDGGRPLGVGYRSRLQTTFGGCGQKPWS